MFFQPKPIILPWLNTIACMLFFSQFKNYINNLETFTKNDRTCKGICWHSSNIAPLSSCTSFPQVITTEESHDYNKAEQADLLAGCWRMFVQCSMFLLMIPPFSITRQNPLSIFLQVSFASITIPFQLLFLTGWRYGQINTSCLIRQQICWKG